MKNKKEKGTKRKREEVRNKKENEVRSEKGTKRKRGEVIIKKRKWGYVRNEQRERGEM